VLELRHTVPFPFDDEVESELPRLLPRRLAAQRRDELARDPIGLVVGNQGERAP
jgi:hypothetical protein